MSQQFIITFKDAGTAGMFVPLADQRRKEFIPLDGPGEILITPVNGRSEFQRYPELEEGEWSIGHIRLAAVGGGGPSTVDVIELLRTTPPVELSGAVQTPPTEHLARSKALTDPSDPFLHVFWGHDLLPPLTFKSAVLIKSSLASPHFILLRLLPRQHLRGF